MSRVDNKFPIAHGEKRLAIIGEAPGEEEVRRNEPFVGVSGYTLNKLLQESKIHRTMCFLGNVYQWRPPGNNISLVSRSSEEWAKSVDQLSSDLMEFKPDLVIALGEIALNLLTGKSSIMKWRGSILPCVLKGVSCNVVPTLHPTSILRQWSQRPIVLCDLDKAKEQLDNPTVLPIRTFRIHPSFNEVLEFISRCHSLTKISIDYETTLDNGCPLCLGIGVSATEAMCIPFSDKWTYEEEFEIWKRLDLLLLDEKVGKVVQNVAFDYLVSAVWPGICIRNIVMDTMLAHHACYPEWPKSLAFQTSIYTNWPYFKEEHKDTHDEKEWSPKALVGEALDKFYKYNCMDCCVTYEISDKLEVELEKVGAKVGYARDMKSLSPAMEMTLRGIQVDSFRVTKELNQLQEQINANNRIISLTFGQEVNVKSPKQLKELLYGNVESGGLGLPPKYKIEKGRKTSKVTTDADALRELARKYPNKGIELILKTVQLRTAQSFMKIETWTDGRIHSSWNVAGTETGRWSSSASIMGGRGLMNIPDGGRPPYFNARVIYCSDPGKVFIGWDKRQAEARYVAAKAAIECEDTTYFEVVNGKLKVHVWFGMRLIEAGICPLSTDEFLAQESDDAKTWYYISKTSIHGFSYDTGPERWSKVVAKQTDGMVIVDLRIAKQIKSAMYATLTSIPQWHKAIQAYLRDNYIMTNALGRTFPFISRRDDDLYRAAYAFEPQSSVADDVADSIYRCYQTLPELEICQQNYDSLLGQCKFGEEMKLIERMKSLVEVPITIKSFDGTRSLPLIIPVEFKVGFNWGEMEEVK